MRICLAPVALLLLFACPRVPVAPPPTDANPQSGREALALWQARTPERFKFVHQVGAQYGQESGVLTGYMLGRKDGSFRVSASAAFGPRLFDVAKVRGAYQKKVHLAQVEERMNPLHIARAIDRTYFSRCDGEGTRAGELFVFRCPIQDDNLDELEVLLDAKKVTPVEKRFYEKGRLDLTIRYEDFGAYAGEWVARKIHLVGEQGYQVHIALIEYRPDFAFDDPILSLE